MQSLRNNRIENILVVAICLSCMFFFHNNCFGKTKLLNGTTLLKWQGDTLLITIKLRNISSENLCIQMENWDVNGNKETNYRFTFCNDPFLMNQINYMPSYYSDITYKFDSWYNLNEVEFPKFLVIHPKSEQLIKIDLAAFNGSIDIDSNYRFIIRIPYFNFSTIDSMASNLKLRIKDIIIDTTAITLNYIVKRVMDENGITGEYWYRENKKNFTTKYVFDENKADEFDRLFQHLGLITIKKVLNSKLLNH